MTMQRVDHCLSFDQSNELGRGVKSTVFHGMYGSLEVAVKRINCVDKLDAERTKKYINKIYREKDIMHKIEQVRHPNIVGFYYSAVSDKHLYLALELCQYTLKDYVEDAQMQDNYPPLQVNISMTYGLQYLHSQNVVHRDLKPENVFLVASGKLIQKVVLGDFGTSKCTLEDMFSFTGFSGTMGYIPQEFCEAMEKLTKNDSLNSMLSIKSDIFALGCLFYYTCTAGEHPFGSIFQRQNNIRNASLPSLEHVADCKQSCKQHLDDCMEPCKELLTKMLSHNPKERPNAIEIVTHPALWMPEKIVSFFKYASDTANKMYSNSPVSIGLLEVSNVIPNQDWINLLPSNLKKVIIGRGKLYSGKGSSVAGLLRAIRNVETHYDEDVHTDLGSFPDGHAQFWTKLCPKLLMHVHRFVTENVTSIPEEFQGASQASVAQRLVANGNHMINTKHITVRLHIPNNKTPECKEDEADGTREEANDDDYSADPAEEAPLHTTEVRGPPDTIAEDPLTYYFGNKRSGGGDIVCLEIDDDVGNITFETEEITKRVAAKHDHKLSGKTVSVQMHNPEIPIPPEHPRTVQVKGMNIVKSAEILQYYFENRRRSGGGDIKAFKIEETDEDIAYITFEKKGVAEAVVKRSHCVDGSTLDVSLYKTPSPTKSRNKTEGKSPEKPEIPEEPPKAVKVTGLKKVHSQEIVQYYFENKRRSSGGEIVEFKYDKEDDNVAYITFENNDVAQAVASKSHQVDNVDLSVSLYTPPKPRPCYEDRVIIEGVKTTTTKECLFNFLEAKTKGVPESLVYGEKEGVVMVTFETNPDFDKLEHISNNLKLEGASIKVSRVTISNCIMVTNVPVYTTKDTVEYYFENNRRSGGGLVEKVRIQDDESILVYFIDHEIIDHVLKRSHTIDGHSMNVNLYLDRLGCTQGDGSEPRLIIPDPIVISNTEWQKIKFLLNSGINKRALERQLVNCHAKIVWPEDSKSGKITTECTLTADVKDCRKLAKAWIQTTERNVDDFMKQIVVVKKSIISDVWDKVMELLQKINIPNPEAVALFVDKEQGNITVVGLKHNAETVSGDIGKIIKEVEDEAEKEKQKVKENLTTIEQAKTKMLLAAKFPNKMEEKYPNTKVKINENKNEISFEGLLADVRGAKCDMYEMIQGFAHCTIDNIPKMSAGLYQLKQVKEHIVKKLSHVTAIWEVVDQKLIIYSISEECIKPSTDIIKSAVVESSIGLNKYSRALINSELWQTKVDELHGKYNGRAFIAASQDFTKVHVCTTDDIANETMGAMNKFLRLHTVLEERIQFTRSIRKLIEAHHKSDLHDISKQLTRSHVQITYDHQFPGFIIHGTEDGITKAIVKLQELANKVKSRDHTVKKPGLGVHMQSSEGKDTLNMVENALPCVVKIKGDDNEDDYMTYDSATTEGLYETIPADGGFPSQTGSRIHASCKACDDRKIYTAEGDMTELSVDVLVNTEDEKLSLTGRLGKVIVSKGGNEIAKACSDYIEKEGKLSEGDVFMSPAGRLKSKFIIHVVGPVWKGGDNKEVDQLTEAVFRAMMQTSKKNLSSIALPAISCGVYSFPVKRATAVIVAALKNFFREEQESSLREVYLCDVKVNTVEAFTEALVGEFGQGSVARYQQQSAAYRPKLPPRNQGISMPADIKSSTTNDEEDSDSDSDCRKNIQQKVLPSMPNLPPRRSSHGGGGGIAIGNFSVSIVKDEIAKQKVDVIVNTTAKNLDLKNGAVSASLSKAAGPQLQQEVTQKYPNGIKDGEVAITAGHGLRCSHIVHGSMMNWDGGTAATGALHDLMAASLKEAQNKGAESIAFPAIGTGNLGFPRDVVAKEMFNAISKFSKSTPQSTTKDVRFIVYQKDFPTINAFEAEERLWTTGDRNAMKRQTRMFEAGPVYSNVQQSQKDSDDDETDYTTGGHHFETDFYSQAHHAKPHPHKLISC